MLEQMTDIRAAAAARAGAATAGRGGGGGRGGRGGRARRRRRTAAAGEPPQRGTDSQEYLKKEQKELLEDGPRARRPAATKRRPAASRRIPRKPFTLQARQTVARPAAFARREVRGRHRHRKRQRQEHGGPELCHRIGLRGGHTRPLRRGRYADHNSRLALIDVATGEVKWVDHGQKAPPTEGGICSRFDGRRRRRPQFRPPERAVQLSTPVWSEDGTKAVLVGARRRQQGPLDSGARSGHRQDTRARPRPRRRLGGRPRRQHPRLDEERSRSLFPVRAHRLLAALRRGLRRRRAARADLRQVGSAERAPIAATSRTSTSPPARTRPTSSTSTKWTARAARSPASPQPPGKHTTTVSPDEPVDRRYLLLHQQAARAVRAGEPAAGRRQEGSPLRPRRSSGSTRGWTRPS